MNKYNDCDMFFGNLIIYKDKEFKKFMNKVTLVYNAEEDFFLLLDDKMINFFDDIMLGRKNALDGFEEAYAKRKFSLTPKEEEGYIFIDESSLENLDTKKGKKQR